MGRSLDGDVRFTSESLRQVLWAFGFAGLGTSAEPGDRPPPFPGGHLPCRSGRNWWQPRASVRGLDGIFVGDQLKPAGPYPESMVVLAAAAASTELIHVGFGVRESPIAARLRRQSQAACASAEGDWRLTIAGAS
jgi:hypothetical protein